MSQPTHPIQVKEVAAGTRHTAMAGLVVFLDLFVALDLWRRADREVATRQGERAQGWTDGQHVVSALLMNLAGGEHVTDVEALESDAGLCDMVRQGEEARMSISERRGFRARWRGDSRSRTFPSPSATHRFLEGFHDPKEEQRRGQSDVKAFIPAPTGQLRAVQQINSQVVATAQVNNPQPVATLDVDATVQNTHKREALYSYKKKSRAYQPFNVFWAEHAMIVHSEFRDGNVPAGYEQTRVFAEALDMLPADVERVRTRSDSAGYTEDFLRFCAEGGSERFGPIEFTCSAMVSRSFRDAALSVPESDWHPVEGRSDYEWAEVCFVPSWVTSKRGAEYRFIATRRPVKQGQLDLGDASNPRMITFSDGRTHHISGVVTNMDWEGGRLVRWHWARCGDSEAAHAVMKEDLAGGCLPSGKFGANAAWWAIMIIALNIQAFIKRIVLPAECRTWRMKRLRFKLIDFAARVTRTGRQLFLSVAVGHQVLDLLRAARRRVRTLVWPPSLA